MPLIPRGISPIIATVILVLISVSAGVMLWLWLSTFVSAPPTGQQQGVRERIKIEAVNINSANGEKYVVAYVRNIGDVPVTLATAYIMDISGNVITYSNLSNVGIGVGQLGTVSVNITSVSSSLQSGFSYRLKLVTSHGVETEYVFVYT